MPSTPPSIHLTDPLLHPFLSPTFSPIAYLNSTLPTLTPSRPPQTASISKSTPQNLSALTTQTQSQIAALSARTATLSDTLTALTDDILRCSSRLTYEVELLRGEAVGLVEAMTSTDGELGVAIRRFVPNGFSTEDETTQQTAENAAPSPQKPRDSSAEEDQAEEAQTTQAIERLRTLQHVRSLLQRTTQTFNSALSFPLPPSLLASASSSLIAINPPPSDPSAEAKGQAALANLKREIADLLASDESTRGGEEGLKTARARVAALREVAGVWKGTGEEKARMKVVESLEGMVEERRRVLELGGGARREQAEGRTGGGGRGFLGGRSG